MNKRPPSTKILDETEKEAMLQGLKAEKLRLENEIETMSISRYTNRANAQYMAIVEKMKKVEDSIKVLSRKKFIYKE